MLEPSGPELPSIHALLNGCEVSLGFCVFSTCETERFLRTLAQKLGRLSRLKEQAERQRGSASLCVLEHHEAGMRCLSLYSGRWVKDLFFRFLQRIVIFRDHHWR